jgi:hypothetical protein
MSYEDGSVYNGMWKENSRYVTRLSYQAPCFLYSLTHSVVAH